MGLFNVSYGFIFYDNIKQKNETKQQHQQNQQTKTHTQKTNTKKKKNPTIPLLPLITSTIIIQFTVSPGSPVSASREVGLFIRTDE